MYDQRLTFGTVIHIIWVVQEVFNREIIIKCITYDIPDINSYSVSPAIGPQYRVERNLKDKNSQNINLHPKLKIHEGEIPTLG